MHARSGTFELSPDKLDDVIQTFQGDQLPQYRQQSGYKGFTLLANRQTGQLLGISLWESEADLHAADELGTQTREEMHRQGGGQGAIERGDWEVVVDDTR
jgi:heme-degrading monooxygenase HmoA